MPLFLSNFAPVATQLPQNEAPATRSFFSSATAYTPTQDQYCAYCNSSSSSRSADFEAPTEQAYRSFDWTTTSSTASNSVTFESDRQNSSYESNSNRFSDYGNVTLHGRTMHLPQATSPKSFWSESEYPASTSTFSTLEKLFYGNTSAARILDKLVSINPTRRAHVDEYDIDTFTAGIHEMISTNTIDAAVRYLGNLYPEVAVIHPDYSTGLFIDKDLPVYYGHNSYYSIPPDYQRCHDKLTEFGTKYARWIVVVICYNAHVTGLIVDVDGANVYYLNSAGDGDLVERLMYSNFPQQHVNNMINFMVPAGKQRRNWNRIAVRNRQPQPAMSNDCGMMFWLYILAFLAGGCDPHAISTFRIRGYEGYHDYSTKAASKYLRSIMRLAALSVLNDPYYISKYTGDVQYA